jgi:hypothetical protein
MLPSPISLLRSLRTLRRRQGNASSSGAYKYTLPLSLYGVAGSRPDALPEAASASLGALPRATGAGNLTAASEALVCIASGSTDQSGMLTIGDKAGNGLAVTLTIYGGTTC